MVSVVALKSSPAVPALVLALMGRHAITTALSSTDVFQQAMNARVIENI